MPDATYPKNRYTDSIVWFNAYDPSSTSFVYNELGESATASGQRPVNHLRNKTVYIKVVLASTTLTVQIEGMPREFDGSVSGQSATWFALWTKTFTASGTTVVTFENPITYMRVGVKVSGNASNDAVTVCGDFY